MAGTRVIGNHNRCTIQDVAQLSHISRTKGSFTIGFPPIQLICVAHDIHGKPGLAQESDQGQIIRQRPDAHRETRTRMDEDMPV